MNWSQQAKKREKQKLAPLQVAPKRQLMQIGQSAHSSLSRRQIAWGYQVHLAHLGARILKIHAPESVINATNERQFKTDWQRPDRVAHETDIKRAVSNDIPIILPTQTISWLINGFDWRARLCLTASVFVAASICAISFGRFT